MKDIKGNINGIDGSMPWDLGGNFGVDIKHKAHCDNCGKDWMRPASYMVIKSDFDKTEFCSYNCRCAYYKKHEQEREYFFENKYKTYFERKGRRKNNLKKEQKSYEENEK